MKSPPAAIDLAAQGVGRDLVGLLGPDRPGLPGIAAADPGQHLGLGRIAALEIEAPNMLANLALIGWAVVQSDNATEPYHHRALDAQREARRLCGRGRAQPPDVVVEPRVNSAPEHGVVL